MNRRTHVFWAVLLLGWLYGPTRASAADERGLKKPGGFLASEKKVSMNLNSSIRDVMNHPSFRGFGPYILPLVNRPYDGDTKLNRVAALLPYHRQVEPEGVVDTINDMVDRVAQGKILFSDFYTERQKAGGSGEKTHRPFLL